SQTTATPSATATAPAMRRDDSDVPAVTASSLRPTPGKSDHNSPSITRTRPMATTRSLMMPARAAYCGGGVGAFGSPEAAARGSGSAGGGIAASGAGLVPVGDVGCSPALAGGGVLPDASLKYLKNSESGVNSSRVSPACRPFS